MRTHARGSAPSISTASDNTPELGTFQPKKKLKIPFFFASISKIIATDYLGSMTNNNTSDLGQSGGSDVVLTHPGAAQVCVV